MRPSNDYLGSVVNFLDERCLSVNLAEKVLREAPKEFDVFPSLKELGDLVKRVARDNVVRVPEKKEEWVSKKCPGIPAALEAICLMIQNGEHDTGAFKWGLEYCGLDAVVAWEIYEKWCEGIVHPFAANWKYSPFIRRLAVVNQSRDSQLLKPR